jgi:predicted DNA-binding transcriptional regulator AlpA
MSWEMTNLDAAYIRLSTAAQLLGISRQSVWRHCLTDKPVRLRSVKIGGVRMTTREWVNEFVAAQNPTAQDVPATGRAATPTDADVEAEQVRVRLGRAAKAM